MGALHNLMYAPRYLSRQQRQELCNPVLEKIRDVFVEYEMRTAGVFRRVPQQDLSGWLTNMPGMKLHPRRQLRGLRMHQRKLETAVATEGWLRRQLHGGPIK